MISGDDLESDDPSDMTGLGAQVVARVAKAVGVAEWKGFPAGICSFGSWGVVEDAVALLASTCAGQALSSCS